MGVLIDTSILIEYERRRVGVGGMLGRKSEPFYISAVTASELLHGVHRAQTAEGKARRSAWVEAILARFPIIEIDLETARAHALVWADLASTGRLIGANNLWLAATCIANELSIATANRSEFERVPGLTVENWSS